MMCKCEGGSECPDKLSKENWLELKDQSKTLLKNQIMGGSNLPGLSS